MASHFHVLIVEDEPLIVEILQETLEAQFRVSSVSTVAGALALLRTSHVDVALVDSVLPDGHGDEIAAYAKAHGISVIGMSGYPHEMYDFECIDHPHLMKPFGTEALFSTIAKVLLETAR
jgi:DNA-binding NtrC family response regulator